MNEIIFDGRLTRDPEYKTGKKNETLTYQEFAERMHSLSLRKRTLLMNKKKIFCEKIKEEAIKNKKY